ncbi:MAG: hypothetical protein Q9222_007680 [Ikaeria aurantiellina]
MATIISSDCLRGAAGRPLLTALIDYHIALIMASNNPVAAPTLQVNGLSSIAESPSSSPSTSTNPATSTERSNLRLNMLRKIRPPPFRHAWTFYHEKSQLPESASYADRLTVMLENIITIKTFWELMNQFPLQNLRMKDSIHFFKRGVQPVWEDKRNIQGGSWTFRVGKSTSGEFWSEVLLLAVGEQFDGAVQKGDDICGLSLSRRFNSDLITIWNRRCDNQASIDGIRDVILSQISPNLKPKEGSFYYKKHSEHNGFSEVIAAMKKDDDIKSPEEEAAKVKVGEVEKAMKEEDEQEGVEAGGQTKDL